MTTPSPTPNPSTATATPYPIPPSTHLLPPSTLDLRPDTAIDALLLHPPPPHPSSERNLWFFWHQGYTHMPGYAQRNVRTWHRRFAPHGWVIRVLDCQEDSPLHVKEFLDVHDPRVFPREFARGDVGGSFARQHTSDLVRFPLLTRYGGVYADVGVLPLGDLATLWNTTLGDPTSPYEVLSFHTGDPSTERSLTNYFLGSRRDNPLFHRTHALFLALWNSAPYPGSTKDMHASPLLKGVPLLNPGLTYTDPASGEVIGPEEAGRRLTDYIVQGQCITLVLGLVDESTGWNGPAYAAEHVFAMPFMRGAQLINDLTSWNGPEAYRLMSLSLPAPEAEPSYFAPDHVKARGIVHALTAQSFAMKLATGIILVMIGPTLGSLWRDNPGSDVREGTYAGWLRWCAERCAPDVPMGREEGGDLPPIRVGGLLEGR